MYLFGLLFLFVIALFTFYLGRRHIRAARLPRPWGTVLWVALVLLMIFQVAGMLVFRFAENPTQNSLLSVYQWAAYILMGFVALTLILTAFWDLALFLRYSSRKIRSWYAGFASRSTNATTSKNIPIDPQRRLFLQRGTTLGMLGVSGGLMALGVDEAMQEPTVERVKVQISKLPAQFDGFRIVQLSDLHVGPTLRREFIETVVRVSNSLNPDLLVITGDLADGKAEYLSEFTDPLNDLKSSHGVYFCTGNHEYFSDLEGWLMKLPEYGIKVLLNEHDFVYKDGARLAIAGVNDYDSERFGQYRHDVAAALDGIPDEDVKILLAHQPRSCYEASKLGVDLQLSGHTHGGQFMPWKYLVYLQQPYLEGLVNHKGTWVYTNRGTGYWGPPLRLGVPSEITELTLVKA